MAWGGGGSIVDRAVVFSPDGGRFLCSSGASVSVFSVATGEEVQVLSGHTDTVTGVSVVHASGSAKGASHCWTSSLDGTARLWDYSAGTLVRTIRVGHPVYSMVIPDMCPGYVAPPSAPKGLASHRIAYLSVWWSKTEAGTDGVPDAQVGKSPVKGGKKRAKAGKEDGRVESPSRKGTKGPQGPGGETDARLLLFDLTTGNTLSVLYKMAVPRTLVMTPDGGLVGAAECKKVVVWDVRTTRSKRGKWGGAEGGQVDVDFQRLHHTKKLTTVALHPSGTRVVAGDEVGQILEWFGLSQHGRAPAQSGSPPADGGGGVRGSDTADACTTVHWHSHRVGSVIYGEDGMYLYSGGEEAVLVIWQLESGEKTFLPRLGGSLVWMARCPTRPTLLAVSCSDNAIRLIDVALMKVERTIQGLRPPPALAHPRTLKTGVQVGDLRRRGGQMLVTDPPPTSGASAAQDLASDLLRWGMSGPAVKRRGSVGDGAATVEESVASHGGAVAMEPREGLLVLPTRNCCLQFWNMSLNRHVGDFQVAPRNYVSTKESMAGETVLVTHVAFGCDGCDMATVERRCDEAGVGEGKAIKFWHRPQSATADTPAAVQWQLNTRSDEPHRGLVTALAFHPSEAMAVSCSTAGDFKVWVKEEYRQAGGPGSKAELGSCWRCVSAASYCDQPCTAVAFSGDGSLLAVGTGSSITLWSSTTNSLLCVLPTQLPEQVVTSLHFLPGSPFLITAVSGKSPALTLLNLLTLSVWWSYSARTQALAADPDKPSHFAAVLLPNKPPKAAKGKAKEQPIQDKYDEEGYLVIFEAASPAPLSCWRVPKAKGAGLVFPGKGLLRSSTAGDGPAQPLVLVTAQQREFVVLNPYAEEGKATKAAGTVDGRKETKGAGRGPIQGTGGVSAFQAVYGNVAVKKAGVAGMEEVDASVRVERVEGAKFTQPWGDLLSRSSHVLPPLARVCPTFLEAMLEKRPNNEGM